MIELKDVSLKYENGTTALYDINLSVKDGEMAYIVGASGAGKEFYSEAAAAGKGRNKRQRCGKRI